MRAVAVFEVACSAGLPPQTMVRSSSGLIQRIISSLPEASGTSNAPLASLMLLASSG